MVLGHETSGVVAEVGHGVKGFQVGDRVAMEPGLPCKGCELCKVNFSQLTTYDFFSEDAITSVQT